MKNKHLPSEEFPESFYVIEMEERLEMINLPTEVLTENCCIDLFSPCMCNCDCKTPPTDNISVN